MKRKIFLRTLVVLILIILIVINPFVWHSFEENYSITGVVKNIVIVSDANRRTIYMNFKTTDGKIYNFHYDADTTPFLEAESLDNLTRLSEGDEVELSIYSIGYYFVNSDNKKISIYVKDVRWLN